MWEKMFDFCKKNLHHTSRNFLNFRIRTSKFSEYFSYLSNLLKLFDLNLLLIILLDIPANFFLVFLPTPNFSSFPTNPNKFAAQTPKIKCFMSLPSLYISSPCRGRFKEIDNHDYSTQYCTTIERYNKKIYVHNSGRQQFICFLLLILSLAFQKCEVSRKLISYCSLIEFGVRAVSLCAVHMLTDYQRSDIVFNVLQLYCERQSEGQAEK